MVEYKNWAAFDGLSDKFDALALEACRHRGEASSNDGQAD